MCRWGNSMRRVLGEFLHPFFRWFIYLFYLANSLLVQILVLMDEELLRLSSELLEFRVT